MWQSKNGKKYVKTSARYRVKISVKTYATVLTNGYWMQPLLSTIHHALFMCKLVSERLESS